MYEKIYKPHEMWGFFITRLDFICYKANLSTDNLLLIYYHHLMKKFSLRAFMIIVYGVLWLSSILSVKAAVTQNTLGFGDVKYVTTVGIPWASVAAKGGSEDLITVIKNFINRMLGMLSLIALVILLRGGFQMVTAAGDEAKYKKGFKLLSQAAVGLVFIAVSRLVVSVIFRLLGEIGVQ